MAGRTERNGKMFLGKRRVVDAEFSETDQRMRSNVVMKVSGMQHSGYGRGDLHVLLSRVQSRKTVGCERLQECDGLVSHKASRRPNRRTFHMDLAEDGLLRLLRPEKGEFANDKDPGVEPSEVGFVREHGTLAMDVWELCAVGFKHLLQPIVLGESACEVNRGPTWT